MKSKMLKFYATVYFRRNKSKLKKKKELSKATATKYETFFNIQTTIPSLPHPFVYRKG